MQWKRKIKKRWKKIHSTQKPEAILQNYFTTTNKGDAVFDPFLGTGTTAVVAKKLVENIMEQKKTKNIIRLLMNE